MTQSVAVKSQKHSVARPLKVLVPLIQLELAAGQKAGLDYYRRVGQMLLEAREQVASFKWGKWLSKNFELSKRTAYYYMKLAERGEDDPTLCNGFTTLREAVRGSKEAPSERLWKGVREATDRVVRDEVIQEKQPYEDEVELHRELAAELIDIGYRALATRLHPDRGGSKDAMTRLNRVRDELKSIAQKRRFI